MAITNHFAVPGVATSFASLDTLERRLRDAVASTVPRALAVTVTFDVPFSLLQRT